MIKSISTRFIAVALVGALMLAGCSKDEEEVASAGIMAGGDSLLQYVPADSPYVLAGLEPLPDSLMDKLEPKLDGVLTSYEALIRGALEMAQSEAEAKGEGADPAEMEKISAVVDELSTLMTLEGLRGAGIERDSTAVLYGVGLLPVMRMEVSDGALFEAALSRLEDKAGEKMSVASIGDSSFRYVEADDAKIIVATFENQVVITLVPSAFDDDQVSQVLGLTKPASNIADAGVLHDIAKEYGYSAHFVGFVDIERIVSTFVGEAGGTDKALIDLMGDDKPELSAVCKAETIAMAGIAPRMVMGYTKVTDDLLESQAVVELRDDIASGLATLPAAVPGLSGDKGGLMSFGMSLDVMAARNFYESRLDALEADPFECEEFANMSAGVAAGREALNQPVPPMVYDFKGFVAEIDEIEGLDLASNTPPTSVDGRMMLAMDNAPALLAMGAMFSPELAGLNIEPNGEPVPFASPQLNAVVEAVHVALTDEALALSFGEGMQDELDGMLNADADDNGTFASFSMDAGRYYAFIGEAMTMAEQDDDSPMPPEMRQSLNDVMVAFSDFYDRMTMDIRFTDRGVEFDSAITIKD